MTNQKAIRNGSAGSLNGKAGHLTGIIDNINNAKNREYEFDALGRLTKAKGGATGNLWSQQYSYDRYGNRTNIQSAGNGIDGNPIGLDGIPNLSYDAASNRITSTGFDYDAAGNQITGFDESGAALKFEYDAANRVSVIRKASDDSFVQSFQYGSTNARLMDVDHTSGLPTIFASVGGSVLSEYTEFASVTPSWTKSHTYLGDSRLATVSPNGIGGEFVEYNHPDRLGTRLVTNQSGGSYSEQAHLPFGRPLASETSAGVTNTNRFASYDRSAPTGLDYAINRTYDSKQGRFTQADPIGMQAVSLSSPQTLNLYSYCGNDPVNFTDPSGLFFGSFFKWLGRVLFGLARSKVAKRIAIRFVVSYITSGFNFGLAIRRVAPEILTALGIGPPSFALTPGWNPSLSYPISFGVGSLSRYIIINFASIMDDRDFALGQAFRDALYLLKFLECRNYIANSRNAPTGVADPADELNRIYRGGESFADGYIMDDNQYLFNTADGSAPTVTETQNGRSRGIKIGQAFYDNNYWKGRADSPRAGRAEGLLHELKHYLGGNHKGDGAQGVYRENLKKKCLRHLPKRMV